VIASLAGRISYQGADSLIVEVGGVGYLVSAPARLLAATGGVGAQVRLFTHTYVREDQLALFGFSAMEDLEFFQLLMSVKGIGPKVALSMISQAETRTLKKAVFKEDKALLATVPGIGPKTAARVILELRDKLKEEYLTADAGEQSSGSVSPGQRSVTEGAVRALTSLGYREAEVRLVLGEMDVDGSLEATVARALKALDSKT
jgi:Holliday junction DNA helicase RuvA